MAIEINPPPCNRLVGANQGSLASGFSDASAASSCSANCMRPRHELIKLACEGCIVLLPLTPTLGAMSGAAGTECAVSDKRAPQAPQTWPPAGSTIGAESLRKSYALLVPDRPLSAPRP